MNSPRTILYLTVVLAALLFTGNARCRKAENPAAELTARIDSLRIEARFREALASANELLDLRREDKSSKSHELADAERLVSTLESTLTLPTGDQRDLARAYKLKAAWTDLMESGNYDEARISAKEQRDIFKRLLGPEHPFVGQSLINLGNLLSEKGDYEEAEALLREGLRIHRRTFGSEHPGVASSLNNLAVLLWRKGDYAEAEPLYREALEIYKETLGLEHPDVGQTVNNLAIVVWEKGEHAEAESLFREALDIRRKTLGTEHPQVAANLVNIAIILSQKGDHEAAEQSYREALQIYRSTLGPQHAQVGMTVHNMATLLASKGDFAAAKQLYREALQIYRAAFGQEHPLVAKSLSGLGLLLSKEGDYMAAEPLCREAIDVQRKILGPEHPDLGSSLNDLAVLLANKGDYAAAEPLYRTALDIHRKALGPEHPHVATGLSNLASLLWRKGDYAAAEPLYREALDIYQKAFGPEHPDVAMCLINLGSVQYRKGDLTGAEPLYRKALDIYRKAFGDENPVVGTNLANLASCLFHRGDYTGAEQCFSQAANVYDTSRLRIESGTERAAFHKSPYEGLAAARVNLGETDAAWVATERGLGRVLADVLLSSETRSLTDNEMASQDSILNALTRLEGQIETLARAALTDSNLGARADFEEARSHLIGLEAEWGLFQSRMRRKYPMTEGEPYSLEKVRTVLNHETAIIGWLDVEARESQLGSWAYVIRNKGPVVWAYLEPPQGEPRVSVGEASGRFREGLALPGWAGCSTDSIAQAGREQWLRCVAPISHAIEGAADLIVIPSGAMLGIPVETLVDETGNYLGDGFSVSYAPSATIHTWLNEQQQSRKSAYANKSLLVADPPFQPDQLVQMKKREDPLALCLEPRRPRADRSMLRYVLAGNEDARTSLERLPCTRFEVNEIAHLVPAPTILLGPKACEQELARLAQADSLKDFSVVHMATHVLVDNESPERSALVLSQVNLPDPLEAADKGERVYDGLVTAKEILHEWKLHADLVVLSGCETALGKEIGGEGYVGLAHTFLQAGARSLIVSLWPVEDRATSLLMERFYENWTGQYSEVRNGLKGKKMSKADALQEAKRYVRTYTEKDGERPFEHPYFWAAFILMGGRG